MSKQAVLGLIEARRQAEGELHRELQLKQAATINRRGGGGGGGGWAGQADSSLKHNGILLFGLPRSLSVARIRPDAR